MTDAPLTPRDLGAGLRLRWSRPDDVDRVAELVGDVFREREADPPDESTASYARALMSGRHPLMTAEDFAVVEDATTGLLVACSCLLAQTWDYAGVAFGVGRPELVATRLPYRRRGLIRAIFEVLHARSAARGDLVQAITGISYFYRQFGYEYALELEGARVVHFADIPAAKPDAPDPYRLRLATLDDLPVLAQLADRARERSAVSSVFTPDHWRYQLTTPPTSDADWPVLLIEDAAGAVVAFLRMHAFRFGSALEVRQFEVAAGVGMQPLVLPVLRALKALAPTIRTFKPLDPPTELNFGLGSQHPWYEALGQRLAPRSRPPYAWYVRVPNLPRFLMRLRPVLEARLARSVAAGYSGELRLDFYRGGLRLVFERGALTLAEDWRRPDWGEGPRASFPPLVFLQALFGYRDLDEIRVAYPDAHCPEELESLLRALFPKQCSRVLPLD